LLRVQMRFEFCQTGDSSVPSKTRGCPMAVRSGDSGHLFEPACRRFLRGSGAQSN
jgi:hypothetical protein